ncbi:MAG: tryptophan synthase subunit alpha, partial [Brevinematia bacterium]
MDNFGKWFVNTKPTIVYLTVGFPSFEESLEVARFLISNGFAQLIEAGIPFSDPIADGEVIQLSTQKAIENGITLKDVGKFVGILKKEFGIPIFAMGYYNPIFSDLERSFSILRDNECDGLIIPDINVEEIRRIKPLLRKYGLRIVGFVAPNTSEDRIRRIVRHTNGFIYLVSSYGTTGVRDSIDFSYLRDIVVRIKRYKDLPVAIGFGIRNIEMVERAKEVSDGAILGSAIIRLILSNPGNYVRK